MPANTGGKRSKTIAPIIDKDGKVTTLRPSEHGVDLPGGSLHRTATTKEAGFMSAAQVEQLEALASRAELDPSDFAPAGHEHEPRPLPEHDHPDLRSEIATLARRVDGWKAPEVEPPEPPDLSGLAPRLHSHDEYAPRDHDHEDLRSWIEDVAKATPHADDHVALALKVDGQGAEIAELRDGASFNRQLAEEAKREARSASGHARPAGVPAGVPWITNEDGGVAPMPTKKELHALFGEGGEFHRRATRNDAGFMAPDHVRMIEAAHDAANQYAAMFGELELQMKRHADALKKVEDRNVPDPAALERAAAATEGALRAMNERVADVVARFARVESERLDPSAFSPRDHSHDFADRDHEHHEYLALAQGALESIREEQRARLVAEEKVEALEEKLEKLAADLAFTRDLAERRGGAIASAAHGHQGGGPLHAAVTPTDSGFMKPQHLRLIEDLQRRVETLEGDDE